MPTKKTGNVKKSTPIKKESARKVYIDNIGAEAFGRAFESIKHTAPAYEPDREELSLAIRAELAVVKAEEEKKAREEEAKPNYHWVNNYGSHSERDESGKENPKNIKDWYSPNDRLKYTNNAIKRTQNNLREQYTRYLIRSIISSLGLGATAMFLILNNL